MPPAPDTRPSPGETDPAALHRQATRPYSEQTRKRRLQGNADDADPPARSPRPQHHLAGLYLDDVFDRLIGDVGRSDTPLDTLLNQVVELPLDIQRDLLCGCLRELRKLIQSTAVREIAEKAYPEKPHPTGRAR